jgi:hypothetical protein
VVDVRGYGDGMDLVPLSIVKFIGKDSTGGVRLLPFIDVGTFLVAAYMRSSRSPKAPQAPTRANADPIPAR